MSIGAHIRKEPSYGEQADKYASMGATCCQIFVKNPSSTADVNLAYDKIGTKPGMKIYVHANYLTHMCKPGVAHKMIIDQIRICASRRFHGLIIHLEHKSITENIAAAINVMQTAAMMVGHKPIIIFEIIGLVKIDNLPAPESCSFETPEKLKYFIDGVAAAGYTQLDFGVCIDTAHLWTMSYNCSTSDAAVGWLNGIGDPSWIKLIHLNDSKSPRGGPDVHDHIGTGRIWPIIFGDRHVRGQPYPFDALKRQPSVDATKEPGFIGVLRFAKQHSIDIILERSKSGTNDDVEVIDELRGIIRLQAAL